MGEPPNSEARTTISLLSISPIDDGHDALEELLDQSIWRVHTAVSLSSAVLHMRRSVVAVVVCDADLLHETWREMVGHLKQLPRPPCLIVTSRLADDGLWTEALNLGVYDVLAKPFNPGELLRCLISAWWHGEPKAMRSHGGS